MEPMRLLDGDFVLSPSDLSKFTRCAHATTLDIGDLNGTLQKFAGKRRSLHTDFIVRKGTEYEEHYIENLSRAGNQLIVIREGRSTREDLVKAEQATLDAMRVGADYIYQAVFFDGKWVGYADLLEKIPTPSALGDWSYEVVDTKLARTPKAHFILQLSSYSEQLARLQGLAPAHMHVVLGTGDRATFRVEDFAAYFRYIKRRFEERVSLSFRAPQSARNLGGGDPRPDSSPSSRLGMTSPYLVEFCSLCEWNLHCWRHLERLDHLVRVANIRRDHVRKLEANGIETLTKLAHAPGARVPKIRPETYATLHDQARLQSEQIRTGQHLYELLTPEPDRGFELLPKPSAGDVFLDLEADPYAGDGLTYLFGIVTADREYHSWWANHALEQQRAFQQVIDFMVARRREHPDMHVYHYTAAEPSALERMSSEFGTREHEIDDFLRAHVFVDLFNVVRQGVRISQPSYSLKKVEAFYFHREEEGVFEKGGPILAYEEWLETRDPATRQQIENYNREDCLSTLDLRDWLLDRRGEAESQYGTSIAWFDRAPDEQSEDAIDVEMQSDELSRTLLERDEPLLAHLVHYHRREARPAWWWFFARLDMTPEELVADSEAIGGIEVTDIASRPDKRSIIHTLHFPPQEHKLEHEGVDPATKKTITIVSIDDATGLVEIKRGSKSTDPLPRALIPPRPIGTTKQRQAIRKLASSTLAPRSGERVALREAPAPGEGLSPSSAFATFSPAAAGEKDLEKYAAALDILHRRPIAGSSYLFVQGPPGAGKTWWGARKIVELLAAGKRVGVTSNSHKAIENLLNEVESVAAERRVHFTGLKKSGDGDVTHYNSAHITTSNDIDDFVSGPQLIAGTSWLFADERLDQTLDAIFIDEAGQVALANALVVAMTARFVYLLGDPLQLAQVSQATHPEGSGASVLEHLLGSDATIPKDRGLFLPHTYRMHPDVCRFVSDVVYDGRLVSADACARQTIEAWGTGLRFITVEHEGNSQSSPEEATRIADEISRMLGATVTNKEGEQRPLRETDVMVVAPYNAQVRCVTETLRARGLANVPAGTVDKFQGRQAEVVFYTMTTSSGDDLPRDIDFLFSRNRLNVAVSRARCLAVVLASPRLLDVGCRTPEQMKLVNALCRFREMA